MWTEARSWRPHTATAKTRTHPRSSTGQPAHTQRTQNLVDPGSKRGEPTYLHHVMEARPHRPFGPPKTKLST